ncbi:crotonobetainyl-CoA:carnitine CoA-transferase CaiB-like acyl-CoA transferase [Nocardioides sp. J9]|uniref:CaiB/BaiF CoA transferase family protein n=1 Tax=Nocardioides sp. J9 TaxID=935844 RepID=UPI0011A37A12|nr:CoA transferase [Nocardioides sp. J9]TWG98552.1 crotonobetainyl-CoA:carnitine CoA-transferase CaiB-like acyl-CoA transferase [Nocardioides sp. J9]
MPLTGIKVLDLTLARAGPTAVRQFADLGATVVRVDGPPANDWVDSRSSDYLNLHRNKRSLRLDLKSHEGKEVFLRLVDWADVLVENFRPRVKHQLGIDYETLSQRNPRLVYGSISGFGQDGPRADQGGVDQIAQGMSGLMSVTGEPGRGPMRVGTAIGDLSAGHFLAFGLLAALRERDISGRGQWVQVSLIESLIGMLDFQVARWTIDGIVPGQEGNDHPTIAPIGVYPTRDGWVNIAAASDKLWIRLCGAIGRSELADDPRFAARPDRYAHRDELNAIIAAATSSLLTADVCAALDAVGVPAGPIYTIDQAMADPQVRHLGMTAEVEHSERGSVDVIRQPIVFSRTPASVRLPAPVPGENGDAILEELGLTTLADGFPAPMPGPA